MLIRIPSPAQSELIAFVTALLHDPRKILQRHIRLFHSQSTFGSNRPCLNAQAGFSVRTVAHDPYIDQIGEGIHEWVYSDVPALFIEDTCS